MTDDGCNVYPRCLECPLVRCQFDEPVTIQVKKARIAISRFLFRDRALECSEIANILGISANTVKKYIYNRKYDNNWDEYRSNEFLRSLSQDSQSRIKDSQSRLDNGSKDIQGNTG